MKTWTSLTGLPIILLCLASPGAGASDPPSLAWQLVSRGTPRVLWADRNVDIPVRLRNVGTATWSEGAGDHLSYHWLAPTGKVVERDGLRARFDAPVPPGHTVELTARVHAPDTSGRWILEWAMVREQVAWYGAPAGGEPTRVGVVVLRRCALLETGFLLLGVGLALAARLRRPGSGARAWIAFEALPVLWTWAAIGLVTVTFSEVSHLQLWEGGGILSASAAALAALPVALIPGRLRAVAGGALVVLVSIVAVADVVYLRYFETVVPIVAVEAARQVGRVEGSVRALLQPADAWLLVGVAGAVAFASLWPRRRRGDAPPARTRLTGSIALAASCLVVAVPALWNLRAALRNPALAGQIFSQTSLVGRWGFVNVHLFDMLRTYREWAGRWRPDPQEEARVKAFFARRTAASAAVASKHALAKGDNLLLIQVESLQEFVIGARVGGAEITPFLNSLRTRALYFPLVFDQSGEGRSSDGEFAVLNSQHALDRGAVAFRRQNNHFVALAEVLREHGYATLSAHAFEKGFWNRGVLHPRYGFERMIFKDELGAGEVIGWGLADGVFFERMVKPLQRQRQPFFAFLITLGLHHPFDLFPDQHKVLDVGGLKGTPLGNYIHAMHYLDASLASFMASMERSGMLANTVVALYGDHEAGLWVDEPLLTLAGQPRWEPSVLVRLRRVPFFVLMPGARPSGEVGAIGGHVDIAPTLLALLGVPAPACFVGHPLDPAVSSIAALNDGSVVGDGHAFVAEGPMIPDRGACYAFPSGEPRPLAECDGLANRGREETEASRFVVIHDLARTMAGPPSP